MQTLEYGGSPSRGPSSDHYGAALTTARVVSLSVGLGLTPGLTTLTSHISASEQGFKEGGSRKGAQVDLLNAPSP